MRFSIKANCTVEDLRLGWRNRFMLEVGYCTCGQLKVMLTAAEDIQLTGGGMEVKRPFSRMLLDFDEGCEQEDDRIETRLTTRRGIVSDIIEILASVDAELPEGAVRELKDLVKAALECVDMVCLEDMCCHS